MLHVLVGSHKTSAIFGPSKTTLGKEICDAITSVLAMEKEDDKTTYPFLFHGPSGASRPFSPAGWCQLIKSVFKRHSGVALSPKDLRSSFITFLRSSHNNETLLKSCAVAMRHSNAMQESNPLPITYLSSQILSSYWPPPASGICSLRQVEE